MPIYRNINLEVKDNSQFSSDALPASGYGGGVVFILQVYVP